MNWDEGISEVKRLHRQKPWKKYTEAYDDLSTRDTLPLICLEDPADPYPYANPDAPHVHEDTPEPRKDEPVVEDLLTRYRRELNLR